MQPDSLMLLLAYVIQYFCDAYDIQEVCLQCTPEACPMDSSQSTARRPDQILATSSIESIEDGTGGDLGSSTRRGGIMRWPVLQTDRHFSKVTVFQGY
jgi:hypothetical protein